MVFFMQSYCIGTCDIACVLKTSALQIPRHVGMVLLLY